MTEPNQAQSFEIGDAVLADLNGVQIPGVVEDRDGERFVIRLAEPWADETGNRSDTATLPADKLDASINSETGGEQLLPG